MKPLIVVSLFGAAALLGLPGGRADSGRSAAVPAGLCAPAPGSAGPAGRAGSRPGVRRPVARRPAPESSRPALRRPASRLAAHGRSRRSARSELAECATRRQLPARGPRPRQRHRAELRRRLRPQAYTQFQSALAPFGGWDYDAATATFGRRLCRSSAPPSRPTRRSGHWVLSEYGWTWASDWSWGWAPFHYGRWITRAGRWSWVPGTMWGPAWVSWRSGGGYVGWSPLPPRGVRVFGGGVGSPWRFTQAANLGAARPAFVSGRYLPGMFARTTVVSTDRLLTRGGGTST